MCVFADTCSLHLAILLYNNEINTQSEFTVNSYSLQDNVQPQGKEHDERAFSSTCGGEKKKPPINKMHYY